MLQLYKVFSFMLCDNMFIVQSTLIQWLISSFCRDIARKEKGYFIDLSAV